MKKTLRWFGILGIILILLGSNSAGAANQNSSSDIVVIANITEWKHPVKEVLQENHIFITK